MSSTSRLSKTRGITVLLQRFAERSGEGEDQRDATAFVELSRVEGFGAGAVAHFRHRPVAEDGAARVDHAREADAQHLLSGVEAREHLGQRGAPANFSTGRD